MRPHLADLDGVAIGAGANRWGRAGGAAGPGDVLDDELLPEHAREVLTDDAANNVGCPAGSERNDHCDRPRRIGLRPRDAWQDWQRGSARGQMQELSTVKFHGMPQYVRGLSRRKTSACFAGSRAILCRELARCPSDLDALLFLELHGYVLQRR